MPYTTSEINAIKFYQGDIKDAKGIYRIKSAYRTINCLMFDGIENELERINEGNGQLQPNIFQYMEEVIKIYCDIYSAMCKSVNLSKNNEKLIVYRTERKISVEELKKGYTHSFTSTSLKSKPEPFLLRKNGLILLTFELPKELPHITLADILGEDYKFSHQEEVLLPPFLDITLKEMRLSNEEMQYRDVKGCPPVGKYRVNVNGILTYNPEGENSNSHLLPERNKAAAEILQKLVSEKSLSENEISCYCNWKKDFRLLIWNKFQEIYKNNMEYKN